MSLVQDSPFACPGCGWEDRIRVWANIHVEADPQVRDAILDGSHFTYRCPQCGSVVPIEYRTLYVDMDRKEILCLLPGEEDPAAKEEAQSWAEDQLPNEGVYSMRFVHSANDLREKLLIFQAGLDDRIVEICKGVALSQVPQGTDVADIRFSVIAGQRFLVLYCRDERSEDSSAEAEPELWEQYVTGFDAFYRQMEEEDGALLPPMRSRNFVTVDLETVAALLRGEA